MKGLLNRLFTLFAATMLLGCSQDDATSNGSSALSDQPIYFLAATNDATTRGTVMPAGELKTSASFRVYATQQRRQGDTPTGAPQEFMPGSGAAADANKVSYQQVNIYEDNPAITPHFVGVWKTATDYFWPQDTWFVNFYAVHPAEAPTIADITTSRQITYDNTTPMPGNYDLMYAKVLKAHREGYGEFVKILPEFGDNSAVALTFHHLLSRVIFYGKLSQQFMDFGWTVEVGGISIYNINAGGTLNLDDATPAITQAATPVLQSYTMTMNENRPVLDALTVKQDNAGNDIPLTSPTEITAVIPQKPTAWDPTSEPITATTDCYLAIQMKIKDADNTYQMGSADSYHTVYVPFQTGIYNIEGSQISWQASKTYSYTLTFGGGYNAEGSASLQPITISAAIHPWNSTTVGGEATHKITN